MRVRCLKQAGFTLIEVIIFIMITGLLMSTLLLTATTALRAAPTIHNQWIALETAGTCMEWFLQQRRLNGYATLTCPTTPSASACSVPSGYTVTTTISCTTWNSDTTYKTITVAVNGLSHVSLSTQIGDY